LIVINILKLVIMEKKWIVRESIDKNIVEEFSFQLKISPVLAELLLQRGINTYEKAERFFRPKLEELHDPFLMKNMQLAVQRLKQALNNSEKILLFGDYDVDGTTSVSLMYKFLKQHSSQLDYYIPDRHTEGYGLSKIGIDSAKQNGVSLIITLDCGIKSVELISYGKQLGIDFIVCDHHQPGEQIPDALVLDPKQDDCNYPYKELCGCGVGFKLLQALCIELGLKYEELYVLLDFVAVAIGADIVPVTGENRILAYHGMRLLNEQTRLPFKRMLSLAKKSFPITLTDVVFTIAPRINSAGRLYSGVTAVNLMISEDETEINTLTKAIDTYNSERRNIDSTTTQEALKIIETDEWYKNSKTTVVHHKNWHKGIVGIVASRLIETHFKPTIVLTENGDSFTGSARTINKFDIYQAIESCESLLEQFGGHTFAAGLTLKKENITPFKHKFEQFVKENISVEDEMPNEKIDRELHFNDIYNKNENRLFIPRLKRILKQMEPHGPHNMTPIFYSKNLYSTSIRILKEKHLRIEVTQADSDLIVTAIGFFLSHKESDVAPGVPFEMIYTLESNIWKQRESLQLNIKDIRAMI